NRNMKFIELKKNLQEKISPCYVISGEDSFLCEHSIELIEKQLFGDVVRNNLNKQVFSTESLDITKFIDTLNTMPFFAQKKLVVLKEDEGKNSGEIISQLKEYLTLPNNSTVLVIVKQKESDFFGSLKTGYEEINCNRLENPVLKKWIEQQLSLKKKIIDGKEVIVQIEPDALETLIDYTNGYLSKISLEIEKLSSFCNLVITKQNVDEIVSKDIEYSIFKLTDHLAYNNTYMVQQIKQDLLSNKKTVSTVLGLLQNSFRRLFYSIVSNGTDEEIANELNVKEFAITKSKELAKKFGAKNLKTIINLCADLDYKTKTSQMSVENATDYLILQIQGMMQA
ncbi:MAG: DNA polymerase III subunit delta, partial [Clostridiales bacterium]|nr:DNA polymerase III subunit delta [Candidatus Apopatousia equi]